MSTALVYKDQERDAQIIADYISSKSQDGEWIPMTIKDIQQIVPVNASYASGIYRSLQTHKSLEHQKGKVGPNGGRKIMEFRPAAPKPAFVSTIHPKYKNLTTKQVYDFQQALSCHKGLSEENMTNLLMIINFLYGKGAHLAPLQNAVSLISDVFLMKSVQVQLYMSQLRIAGIYTKDNEGYTLHLPQTEESPETNSPAEPSHSVSEDAETQQTPDTPTLDEKEPDTLTEPEDKNPVAVPASESELVEGLRGFSDLILQFKQFVDERIPNASASAGEVDRLLTENAEIRASYEKLHSDHEALKKDLEKGQQALDRLLNENQLLKDRIESEKSETKKYKDYYGSERQLNENMFAALQENMQILIADINGTIVDFTRIPAWKIKPADNARVQQEVLNAVTTAIDRVNQANKSGSRYVAEK